MTGLPKKYARMGFKRGWAAFNKTKRKTRKTKTKVYTMARRKHYSKRRSYKRSSGMGFGNAGKVLIGSALAGIYEIYVSPLIPMVTGMIKNILELFIGLWLSTARGMPSYVKSFGLALAFINGYQLITPYLGGGLSQTNPSNVSSVTDVGW
jgi:hypothetical protein